MRLARLPLAALALIALAACSNDVTAPEVETKPASPVLGQFMGSGMKATGDTIDVVTNSVSLLGTADPS